MFFKLLDLDVPDVTYTELINLPSSGFYSALDDTLNELYYDGQISYRSISRFLFNIV
jgi:hypothetical protein